jgi:hypothetical protein
MTNNFNFQDNCNYTKIINDDLILHIDYAQKNIATLTFTDKTNTNFVPENIAVYNFNPHCNSELIRLNSKLNIFFLCSTDRYVIKYNDEIILQLKPISAFQII